MNKQEPTKDIFCAKCQTETPHTAKVDSNGEFVFFCTTEDCGRFVKFPADIDPEGFTDALATHQEQNLGQVSLEGQEEKLAQLLGVSLQNAQLEDTQEEPEE